MGASASAMVGIGKIFYPDQLPLKKKIRGCKHEMGKDINFCPKCGQPRMKDKDISLNHYAEDNGLKEESEYYIIYPSEVLFAGKVLANVGLGGSYDSYKFPVPNESDVEEGQKLVQKICEQSGVEFNPTDVGMIVLPLLY